MGGFRTPAHTQTLGPASRHPKTFTIEDLAGFVPAARNLPFITLTPLMRLSSGYVIDDTQSAS
jgi:hypothetical protein